MLWPSQRLGHARQGTELRPRMYRERFVQANAAPTSVREQNCAKLSFVNVFAKFDEKKLEQLNCIVIFRIGIRKTQHAESIIKKGENRNDVVINQKM